MPRFRRLASAALPSVAALLTLSFAARAGAGEPYDIERYLNIRSAYAPTLAPDGKTVAFLTNITGTAQVWTIPAGGGWPEQITFFPDRVATVAYSPRGDWLALAKDAGGDENFQIYLASPDGARLVDLSGAPAVRHDLGGWSRDGKLLSYASNAREKQSFDVYLKDIDTGKLRRLTDKDGYWNAGPISHNGKLMAVTRSNGSLDKDVFMLSLEGGVEGGTVEPALLTPHQGVADFRPIGFSADDRALWLVSDIGREFYALARLDLESKQMSWVREPSWDVSAAALSDDSTRLAYLVNEEGYDRLGLIDATTLKELKPPAVQRGKIGSVGFSRDGKTLALTLSGPTRPNDAWLADLASGRLKQVTRSSTAGIPRASFVEPSLVRYKSFDGLEVAALLYLPAQATMATQVPCLVMPHGGPEGQSTPVFSAVVQYYVNRGYAAWLPNVRGSTGYGRTFTHLDDVTKREDSVRDLAVGVDRLKVFPSIDVKRLAVMGGSYGGYMTLAAATLYPDLWAAAIDSFGIANFRTFFSNTASYRVALRASEYGDPVKDADFLDAVSPLHKVDRIKAPLLVLQGANDPRVPQAEAEQIVAAVRQKGGVVDYILFPDEGHGWAKLANQIKAHRASAEFLDRYLKPRPLAPPILE